MATRAGRSLAFDYYEALTQLMRAVLAIGDQPAPEAVARVEAFRAMLRQRSSPPPSSSAKPKSKPGSTVRGGHKNAPKATAKPRSSATPSAGSRMAKRDPAIRPQTDPVDAALDQLDGLIGLDSVKEEVQQLGGFAYIERQRVLKGEPPTKITRHLVTNGPARHRPHHVRCS